MANLYQQIAALPPEKRELFEAMLMEQGVDLSEIMIVPQKRDQNRFPLSFSQQRLWFLEQMQPGTSLYNITSVLRLRGNLQISALEYSFNEVVRRHEVLRTTFTRDTESPLQVIHEHQPLAINLQKLPGLSENKISERINAQAFHEANQPFNLEKGPLLRLTLLQFSELDHVLILTLHHIVSDNWSTGLLVAEILQLYKAYLENRKPDLPELPVQYADFSVWQRKWLQGKTLDNLIQYWKKQLQGIPALLEFPLDRPRPAYQTSNGSSITFQLSSDIRQTLVELSRKQDVTLFMTLLAIFEVLLYRYSGQTDICVGSPIANRNRSETEFLIGFFVNTLVFRADLSGNPAFSTFLKRVKEDALGAYAHQDLPFETLVEALQPERNMSHSPLFQMMFVLNNAPVKKLQLPELEISLIEIENKTTKFDLILNITESDDILKGKLEYNTDLFNTDTMQRLVQHYQILTQSILENPHRSVSGLPLLTEDEKIRLTREWNRPSAWYKETTNLPDLLLKQAARSGQSIALKIAEYEYSYSELHHRVMQLSSFLINRGLKKGQFVGIYAHRSMELIVGLLATLRAGGIYLPLDPTYPDERIAFMINDTGANYILTQQALVNQLPASVAEIILLDKDWPQIEHASTTNFPEIMPDDLAYIIYTSGSTGQPKGVLVEHGVIANHCLDMADYYELTPEDHVLQFAALNFDASLEQIFPTLIRGAMLVMRDDEIWPISTFHQKMLEYGLSVINPPTAYWAQLAKEWSQKTDPIDIGRLRLVIAGGDVLSLDALKDWHKLNLEKVRLINAYGPTECIITATTYEIPNDFLKGDHPPRVPIGRPRANRECYVLDRDGQIAPTGIPGELYIGGTALARGYLNRDDLTEKVFIKNALPFPRANRFYKTGDLVRFLPDGNLDFLGRVDQQVKIRGFRIELGEIESALRQHDQIKEAVVTAWPDTSGQKRLVAYFVTRNEKNLASEPLRAYLLRILPEYMIPSLFIQLEAMPLDPSGKINRRALPQPDQMRPELQVEFIAPRTETEIKLAGILRDILQIEKVGVLDNFFSLGGHSMMATQVVSRIRDLFNVDISLRAMFENPTIEGIAKLITMAEASEQDEHVLSEMLDEIDNLSEEDIQRLLDEDN